MDVWENALPPIFDVANVKQEEVIDDFQDEEGVIEEKEDIVQQRAVGDRICMALGSNVEKFCSQRGNDSFRQVLLSPCDSLNLKLEDVVEDFVDRGAGAVEKKEDVELYSFVKYQPKEDLYGSTHETCSQFSKKNQETHITTEGTHYSWEHFPSRSCGSSEPTVHKRAHGSEKVYSCSYCPKQCSYQSDLIRHRRTHTGEKPYSCDVCQREFSCSSNCRKHKRKHTGEKPYCCEVCSKQFSTSTDLVRHRRTHTGEKPYSCEVCRRQFAFLSNLREHERKHTGEKPYCCEHCPKQFSSSSNLRVHKRVHTGENPSVFL